MELFDEDFKVNEKTDNKKSTTIILALIIFLIIMVLVVIGMIFYIKQSTLTVKLNGETSNTVKNMLNIDENNKQKVYVPIRQVAKSLGYNDYNGSYTTKSEETNQCYVECENEVAMFSLGSKVIYKTLTNEEADFEYFNIDEPVKAINGELYTTIDGIEKAFNVSWNYDVENNRMNIYTMPYLINSYAQNVVNYGYDIVSEDFQNQKAILDGMLIVEKGKESNNKKVAVLDVSGGEAQTLLEPKYTEIEYLQHTQDFLVTADKKKGIISNNRKTKVKLQYDDIKLMDYEKKLYAVEISGKYGVINFNGEKILNADFSEIGVDISNFKENDIRSKYIVAGSLIPIKRDKLWGFFDINGNQVTDFKYDNLGYITSNNKAGSGYSLLSVPEYNVVVVGKDKKYTVITTKGEEIWGLVFDSIYLSIYGGQTTYKLEYNSKEYDLTQQLDGMGYGKNTSSNKNSTNQQENNGNNNENNNDSNNQNQQQNNNQEQNNNQDQQNNNEENQNNDDSNNNNNDNNNDNGNNDNGNNNNGNNNNDNNNNDN